VKQTNDGQHVWEQASIGSEPAAEPYYASLKKIGEKAMGRHRRRNKELYPQQFEGMVCSDNWRNEKFRTSSIRSGKSLEN
jgi:hypothetical protein